MRSELVQPPHERDQDKAATRALVEARAAFDREARAHRALVESIVIREAREVELGQFILAQDPSYRARRQSGASISEEDGAGRVDEDPLTDVPTPPAGDDPNP